MLLHQIKVVNKFGRREKSRTGYIMQENQIKKEKKWILKCDDSAVDLSAVKQIADSLGLDPIIARLLYNRGYQDAESARSFLYMESEILCNPFDMKDMLQGVKRVERAIKNHERITIYGDYDVDGVTSVCTLYLYLKSKGADVDYYIPNRAGEGYGVSNSAIQSIKDNGSTLIITVDTGITANDEVDFAKSIGVDFVITDHHECRDNLPNAEAVINPHRLDCTYPFKELAGVGVVFKFLSAYEEYSTGVTRIEASKKIFSDYADLVAIGTIADVMPIKGENRIIVSYGLNMIDEAPRLGLSALIDASSAKADSAPEKKKRKTKISSGYVGYTLAPRINAAGRIKTASMAVELFLATESEKARVIAEELCTANKERQGEENKIMQDAYAMIENMDIDNNPVIVLDADDWHHGVIGIVASRITEKYSRPSILVSFLGSESPEHSEQDIGKGSGRSIKGMNLVDALFHCEEHLVKFGGHELAAGLSVTRGELDNFRRKINEYARANLKASDMVPTYEADAVVDFSKINLALAEQLSILEPYGVGNPVPAFVVKGLCIAEASGVSGGKHTRLSLTDGKNYITAMYFSNSPEEIGVFVGEHVDVLFNLDVNEWYGRKSAQLIVRDIKPSEEQRLSFENDKERFEEIRAGAPFSYTENVIPTRDDFATVYKYIVSCVRNGHDTLSHRDICSRLLKHGIGYIKLKVIIMVFREMNIITIDDIAEDLYRFSVHYSTSKADLDKSNLLRRLRSQLDRN